MRCNNCGFENNDYAQNCVRCGVQFTQPQYQQPQGGYQQPPQYHQPPGGYQAPPQYQQAPPKQHRAPSTRTARTSDVLVAAGGVVAFGAGVDSLGGLRAFSSVPAQYIILGVFALIVGLFAIVTVAMPTAISALDSVMGLATTGLGAVMLVWGLAACFLNNVGWNGGSIAAAGISMVFGGLLKMGVVK